MKVFGESYQATYILLYEEKKRTSLKRLLNRFFKEAEITTSPV
jgi:hypothetical protein